MSCLLYTSLLNTVLLSGVATDSGHVVNVSYLTLGDLLQATKSDGVLQKQLRQILGPTIPDNFFSSKSKEPGRLGLIV